MTEANPRTESLFWSALAFASPEERARFLDEACGGDQQLRGRIEELLAAYPKVEGFLEPPAPGPSPTRRSTSTCSAIAAMLYSPRAVASARSSTTIEVTRQAAPGAFRRPHDRALGSPRIGLGEQLRR
jgi:hypothetical protein